MTSTYPAIEKQKADTRGAADAFVQDLAHMRRVLAQAPPDRGDLRRMSAILRRLLVNDELQSIAPPRIGLFLIDAPDNKPIIDDAMKERNLQFFASAGATIRYDNQTSIAIDHIKLSERDRPPSPFTIDRSKKVALKVPNYLSQKVFYIHGHWITRREVIQYVANIGSGVHSGRAELTSSGASNPSAVL
jgi:hypothetical protein